MLYSLPGYLLYTNFDLAKPNLGLSGMRGVCIYVKEGLTAAEVDMQRSKVLTLHQDCLSIEQLWISAVAKGNQGPILPSGVHSGR